MNPAHVVNKAPSYPWLFVRAGVGVKKAFVLDAERASTLAPAALRPPTPVLSPSDGSAGEEGAGQEQ